jgi:hypothetical protein
MKSTMHCLIAALMAIAMTSLGSCDKSTSPDGGDLSNNVRAAAYYGPDTVYVEGGDGACGGYDSLVLVTSPCSPIPSPALIGGGSADSLCGCDLIGDTLAATVPLTTLCETDSLGHFETSFVLPALFADVRIELDIVADDGAEISVNGVAIAQVSLNDGDPAVPVVVRHLTISGDSLFVPGVNVIAFDLVNTGTGVYGPAAGRADTADCMYLEFNAEIGYVELPNVTIDVKPGSDENPINCTVENGVIPVAILTTAEFDAANVDYTTVRFGPGLAAETHMKRHVEDVDYDGDLDLVFHFRGGEAAIACSDTSVTLWGTTLDGYDFEAHDHIRIVPKKN